MSISLVYAVWTLSGAATAQDLAAPVGPAAQADLAQLSLEDLLSSNVTSVAKTRQTVSEAPAAVFVIGQEDIRRSGATNVPELLRMAPGVEVASSGGGGYSVSIRGFNGRYANKVLVLVDGRSIYVSTLSSVLWDEQLVPVEQIERIEVVRGPGGAIWGANAVNGVINVVTKHAVDTQGGQASLDADSTGGARADLRYGLRLGDAGVVRLYGTMLASRRGDAEVRDHSDGEQAGFRYDVEPTDKDAVTVQGDAQLGDLKTLALAPGSGAVAPEDAGHYGAFNVLARWTRDLSDKTGFTLQSYFDRIKRTELGLHFSRDQYDLDASSHFDLGAHHRIVWGLEYRLNKDDTAGQVIVLSPASRTENWYGGFVQDEVAIAPKLKVSFGGKLEHNIYTGLEFQPSLRAIWRDQSWSTWAAVSRSVRTPSRFEADGVISTLPGSTSASSGSIGGQQSASEKVIAYEIGFRGSLGPRVDFDLAGYHNDYSDLLIAEPVFAVGDPYPVKLKVAPIGSARSTGAEAALNAKLSDRWTVKLAGDLLDLHINTGLPPPELDLFVDQRLSPKSQISIRSWFDLTPDIDADIWLRHVAALPRGDTPAYTNLDLRMAWRVSSRLELMASGYNLLRAERVETAPINSSAPTVIPRRVQLGLTARF